MSLGDTFYEDMRLGRYNFFHLKDESEDNKKQLYNMMTTIVQHKDEPTIRIHTENGLKWRHLGEKYKMKGINVTTIKNENWKYSYLVEVNTKHALQNLQIFYEN